MLRLLEATMRRALNRQGEPASSGVSQRDSLRQPPEAISFQVRVDLHVHREALGASGSPLRVDDVTSVMARCDLAGLVVSCHDALPDRTEADAVNRALPRGKRIYRAAEVSTSEGHCLVIGLPALDGIAPGISTWDLVKVADAHQAAVILVHPLQPTPLTPRPASVSDMAPGIHAVEVMSTVTRSTQELEARLFAHERGWIMVAGSDALTPISVGAAYSTLPRLPRDEAELAALIRAGSLRPERAD